MPSAEAQARYPLTQGVNPWLVTVSVMLPTFMEVLDTAIASVALPYIAGSLSASNSEATWVLTSYLVANAVILPASNWFARRFGRKRFLLFCVVIFILPLYYQEILGYTAFTAGMVVGPRGIGSFIGSPIIGVLSQRIDQRKLLCAGFLGFAVCSLIFSMINLDIGPYTLLIPITLTGFALSFVFVPMSTMMMATIPRKEMGNATGLSNMLRNIGGSIGIAMATTALIRRAALHQSELGSHITPSTWVFQQRAAAIAGYVGHRIGPAQGRPGAMGLMYGLMMQQSALMAYTDVFRWTALLAFFCAAAAWLFKKPDKHAAPPPGVH